ncbi:50S ribosomal protein L11 methyltransferase [Pacificimonas sp. WHA3]|uniref:50S ribosomal protein L11 methyltransferase n=1 Tax=Pacificimonas pallii TaxID=2827236 RepID=A0ABS6SF73_9SPHN|nr:50S ribosomal protein L11 methyltransferase [Pacificimonas pallii]MBV7257052.1 50S ribosomal protein L11 methyltransferase [Pacificimonas pallii]
MTKSWKLTLPISRADADALTADMPQLAGIDPQPALMTSETDPDDPSRIRLDVYVGHEPTPEFTVLIQSLLPTSPMAEPIIVPLPEEDWVTLSQAGLDPIRAGLFMVHAARDADQVPADAIGLQIEAGLAFGTGHHPTTAGCLRALSKLARAPENALDLGTGTALLALGIAKAFPTARMTASDIDAVSIDVARENLHINRQGEGETAGQIALIVADGLADAQLAARAPYDLIVANILAQPLIDMSVDIAAALSDGGTLLLAGLLSRQEEAVCAAYRAAGLTFVRVDANDGWPIVMFAHDRARA